MHTTGLLEDDNYNSSHTHFFAMCVIKGQQSDHSLGMKAIIMQ